MARIQKMQRPLPQVQYHGLTIKFEVDDLLSRHEQAIAIATDSAFSLNAGLGRALANVCGTAFKTAVFDKARAHGVVTDPTCIAVPSNYALNCGYVLLTPLRTRFQNRMSDVFLQVFLQAISLNVTSLVIPPLGTGGFQISMHNCAQSLRSALEDIFDFGTLTTLTIVDRPSPTLGRLREEMVAMVADDLVSAINAADNYDPSLQPANSSNTASSAGSNAVAAQGSAISTSPFSMFYNALTTPELEQARQKRMEEVQSDPSASNPLADDDTSLEACPVCLLDMLSDTTPCSSNPVVKLSRCVHMFHQNCIIQWFSTKPQCPICNTWYMLTHGNQPADGTMEIEYMSRGRLEGMPNVRGYIRVTYTFPPGVQSNIHPRPGVPYSGVTRVCYLPNTDEGIEVSNLLKIAFDRRLIFTVGDSVTSGQRNVITWNGIHHKTSRSGGPTRFGYPDPTYLDRVKQELAAVGVVPSLIDLDTDDDDDDEDL